MSLGSQVARLHPASRAATVGRLDATDHTTSTVLSCRVGAARFGLGMEMGPQTVTVQWHDTSGALHSQDIKLTTGTHNLMLTDTIKEIPQS